jgi:hypothetical protein
VGGCSESIISRAVVIVRHRQRAKRWHIRAEISGCHRRTTHQGAEVSCRFVGAPRLQVIDAFHPGIAAKYHHYQVGYQ